MASMKMKYGEDTRRVTLDRVPSFEELARLVRYTYGIADFVIKYEDEEFDLVTVASDEEVMQAAHFAGRTSGVLRFEVFDTANKEKMKVSQTLTPPDAMKISQTLTHPDAPYSPSNPTPFSSTPLPTQNMAQLFDLEALKRLFCNFEISDFIMRLNAIGFLCASQAEVDAFVRTLQTIIAESSVLLKHSSGKIPEEVVHEGIFCNNCQSKVTGVRYKCAFCYNFDLCSRCEASGLHDISHPRVKIVKPVDGVIEHCAWSAKECGARYNAQVVKTTSVSDCVNVAPRRSFVKVWRIRNNGPRSWPANCSLSFVDGSSFSAVAEVPIFTCVAPNQEFDISVEMVSPSTPGRYQSSWCLKTPDGNYFGEKLWCDIYVLPSTPTLPSFIADGQAHLMEYELKNFALKEQTVNAQGTNSPVKEMEKDSVTALQDMGFSGDLLTILRKNRGDIADTIHELILE